MSWFWRGAQSAAFYYLSCTPWFSYLNERKREKERNQARAAKTGEDVEIGRYVHPLPSDTNPHWHEEMMMGPGLKRGRPSKDKAKSESTKRLNTGGQDSSVGENSMVTFSSIDDGLEDIDVVNNGWNKKKYDRPDEFLWGSDDPNCGSYASLSSRAANKPLVSGDGAYYNAPNPAVSELHPPVISNRPNHASQALWMTQPPPPAKIMEGKERADRSRSVSNASHGSARGTGGAVAGRQVGLRRLGEGEVYDDLPNDMDPSPPDNDGRNLVRGDQQRDRLVVNPVTDKKQQLLSAQSSNFIRGASSDSPSRVDPIGGRDLSNSAKAISPASSLQVPKNLAPSTAKTRTSSPLRDIQNTKLPPSTEVQDQVLAYTFPLNKSNEDNDVVLHRWSMDT